MRITCTNSASNSSRTPVIQISKRPCKDDVYSISHTIHGETNKLVVDINNQENSVNLIQFICHIVNYLFMTHCSITIIMCEYKSCQRFLMRLMYLVNILNKNKNNF